MSRAVRFHEFGSPEVLRVEDVEVGAPGPGHVAVEVSYAGLNPVDYKIFHGGAVAEAFGASLPSGNGTDFAGVITAIGEGVTEFAVSQRVLGGLRHAAQAEEIIVGVDQILPLPDEVTDQVGASLWIPGRTAVGSIAAVAPARDDTVLVSAAAGGVGVIVVQLLRRLGVTVVGTASERNHAFLRELGVVPVAYGDGLADRIREVAPNGIDAVLDNAGSETLDVASELGVSASRINSIADKAAAESLGASTAGASDATSEQLAEVVELVASGGLIVPIDRVYEIDDVVDAYNYIEQRSLTGKVVLAVR